MTINDQFWELLTQNRRYKTFYIVAEAFQCQIGFIIDEVKAWEGNRTWILHPNISFDAFLRPKKVKNEHKNGICG